MNYRITLAYDGTNYCGWQLQLDRPTVQGALAEVLRRFAGVPVVTHGAGRTDAGVHAEGQVVSFKLDKVWEGTALRRALNANLPLDIRVLEAAQAEAHFHPRIYAKGKTYRYQLYNADVMHPLWERYAWHFPYQLDLARLAEDGRQLLGTHDFSAFTTSDCETKTRVRTLDEFKIEIEGQLLKFWFSGGGFLRYQVRTMIGALVAANRDRLPAGSLVNLLQSKDRTLAGASAPAKGLTLVKVEY
jgi:tRNA pseudouridine38-40 synthase